MTRTLLALALVLAGSPVFAQVQPSGFPAGITPPIFGNPSAVTGNGTVTSAQLLAPDGSAAAPSYSFANNSDTGFYNTGNEPYLAVNGAQSYRFAGDTLNMYSQTAAINLGASADVSLSRGAADVLQLASGDKFAFGGVTSSQPMLKASGLQLHVRQADDASFADIYARIVGITSGGSLALSANAIFNTAPTVTSAGTSPSIVTNGTAAMRVGVGTGGTATTIVLAMPAATTGWNCFAENITATAANRANQRVVLQSSTTTAATLQNQTISTGAALAFTASDTVAVNCVAY